MATNDDAATREMRARLYSTDPDTSAQAFAELQRSGRAATPVLIEALRDQSPRVRRLAAEGLAELRDPASADALERATHDSSGEVRSRAAAALHLLGDPRAVEALVRTLDDYPDVLHNPYTASMMALTNEPAALPLLAPLLKAPELVTRRRALLVVKAIVSKQSPGEDWDAVWRSLGSYDPAGDAAARNRAADLWADWIRSHAASGR